MKVGDKFYFYVHAYHHVVGEVAEFLGPKTAVLKNPVWVYSCRRGWTEFFKDGIRKDDTVFHHLPDGTEVSGWFMACPWNHPIPKRG